MVKRSGLATLSHMINSASEDDFQQTDGEDALVLTPTSAIENIAPRARKVGQAKGRVSKAVRSKAPPRRVSAGSALASKGGAAQRKTIVGRKALTERPNPTDTEEVDEFDEAVVEVAAPKDYAASTKEGRQKSGKEPARIGRPPKAKSGDTKPDKTRVKIEAASVEPDHMEIEELAAPSRSRMMGSSVGTKRPNNSKRSYSPVHTNIIPETQVAPEVIEVDATTTPDDDEDVEASSTHIISRTSKLARNGSRQPFTSSVHRRPGNVSDSERASEPAVRRKLGEMTGKFENMDIKYRSLREVAMRDAESNFDRLKKAADERANAQEDLIVSLKRELSSQKAIAAEARSLHGQMAVVTAEKAKLASENKALSKSLLEAQNESRSLTAKLAAARATSQKAESLGPKLPGSAGKNASQRPVLLGGAEAAKEAQRNQLKEELYRDLTGLVILGVKTGEEENVYDCIQTGRNGTLHFHLAVAAQDINGKTSAAYEDSEYEYIPLIDGSRDGHLLEILPDCLKEEICFPGVQAAKFYIRIFDSMTKRIEVDD